MQVSKWGNSLAIRIPADVVKELSIKEGDHIEVVALEGRVFGIQRDQTRERASEKLTAFRGRLPKGFKFNREEASER
jgi:antitoxin MazE